MYPEGQPAQEPQAQEQKDPVAAPAAAAPAVAKETTVKKTDSKKAERAKAAAEKLKKNGAKKAPAKKKVVKKAAAKKSTAGAKKAKQIATYPACPKKNPYREGSMKAKAYDLFAKGGARATMIAAIQKLGATAGTASSWVQRFRSYAAPKGEK